MFREDPLSRNLIERLSPFDQTKSDAEQPIRIVEASGLLYVMQGNHRIMAAREDKLPDVKALLYTESAWESLTESAFMPRGTNNPRIGP